MNIIDKHTITKLEIVGVSDYYPREIGKNSIKDNHGHGHSAKAIKITTNKGITGWGLPHGRVNLDMVDKSPIIGKNLSEIFDVSIGVIQEDAITYDFVLHDLVGKILNKPVYEMMGENKANTNGVPAYDGSIYMNDYLIEDSRKAIELILSHCKQDNQFGYSDFKLKIGRGHKWMDRNEGMKRDIEVVRSVRERYPDAKILVDGNDGFTLCEFLDFFKQTADCNIYWIEEPFAENEEDLKRLKEMIEKLSPETLIADGEADPDVEKVIDLAEKHLIDVVLFDIVSHGLTKWREYQKHFTVNNIMVSPHAWPMQLKTCYNAHMALAYPNIPIIEGVTSSPQGYEGGYKMEDGLLYVPENAGFGLQLL